MEKLDTEVFCVHGKQSRSTLTADDGTEYKLFGNSSHREGFFMITWRNREENVCNLLKFVHSEAELFC